MRCHLRDGHGKKPSDFPGSDFPELLRREDHRKGEAKRNKNKDEFGRTKKKPKATAACREASDHPAGDAVVEQISVAAENAHRAPTSPATE